MRFRDADGRVRYHPQVPEGRCPETDLGGALQHERGRGIDRQRRPTRPRTQTLTPTSPSGGDMS